MDRRSFLRRFGLGGAALVVAPRALEGLLDPPAKGTEIGESFERIRPDTAAFAIDRGALTASGGLCAPVTPYYTLPSVGRPLRDALPSFDADRGGIRNASCPDSIPEWMVSDG